MRINEIITEAIRLKPQDRYIVIEELIHSLDKPDKEIDNLWLEESAKRLATYQNGDLKTISYDEAFIINGSNR